MTQQTNRRAIAARNALIYHELTDALHALAEAGITAIVLKGAALAMSVYPNIADRVMSDADLLVRPEQRNLAKTALESAGFQFLPETPHRFGPFDTAFTGEMSFRRVNGAVIELHWEIEPIEWFRRLTVLDMNAIWKDAQLLVLGHTRSLQLSPVDMMLHLCLHLAQHGYTHLVGYSDILQLLKYHPTFDWDRFLLRARRFRLRAICYFPLEVAFSVLEAPIPPAVLKALMPPVWRRGLVRRIADPHRVLAGTLPPNKMRNYLLHLVVAERSTDVLRLLAWLFFPGPHWLAERYRFHSQISSWVACLWHPFFVLGQGALSLWAVIGARR